MAVLSIKKDGTILAHEVCPPEKICAGDIVNNQRIYQTITIEKGVTVRHILEKVQRHPEKFACAMGIENIKDFVNELELAPQPIDTPLSHTLLHWNCEIEYIKNEQYILNIEPEWIGISKNRDESIPLNYYTVPQIADLPIEFKEDFTIWQESSNPEEDSIPLISGVYKPFTFRDLFQAILLSICFFGTPKNRDRILEHTV